MEPAAGERAILDMTDAEAIARSSAEPAAFGAVFDRHFQAVYAYAQRRVGLALAEEVAAETFARARVRGRARARRRGVAAAADGRARTS
jgi:RNA polymerase sigma-70 factor, ECF subfamily